MRLFDGAINDASKYTDFIVDATGNLTITPSGGNWSLADVSYNYTTKLLTLPGGVTMTNSTAGATQTLQINNLDNTNVSSDACCLVQTGGSGGTSSGGDPYFAVDINSVTAGNWSWGIDNSVDESLVWRNSYDFTGSDVMTLTTAGVLTTTGGITLGGDLQFTQAEFNIRGDDGDANPNIYINDTTGYMILSSNDTCTLKADNMILQDYDTTHTYLDCNKDGDVVIYAGTNGGGSSTTFSTGYVQFENETDIYLKSADNTIEEKNMISWRIEDNSEAARICADRTATSDAPHDLVFYTRNSSSVLNANMTLTSEGILQVDTINEITADNGVSIESCILKDGGITTNGATEDVFIAMEGTMMNPSQAPTWTLWGTSMYVLPFSINDAVHFTTEIPHSRKLASNFTPHVHMIVQHATPPSEGEKIKFEMIYRIGNIGGAMSAETTIYAEYTAPAGVSSGDHIYVDFSSITGTSYTASAIMVGRFKRVSASSNEYGQDISVNHMDLHVTIDKLGLDI